MKSIYNNYNYYYNNCLIWIQDYDNKNKYILHIHMSKNYLFESR